MKGEIGTTGKIIKIETEGGTEIETEEPEEIHTASYWEKKGRKIKENQEPITEIKIWKPYNNAKRKGVIKSKAKFYKLEQTEEKENVHSDSLG